MSELEIRRYRCPLCGHVSRGTESSQMFPIYHRDCPSCLRGSRAPEWVEVHPSLAARIFGAIFWLIAGLLVVAAVLAIASLAIGFMAWLLRLLKVLP